jgi:hypothetical protein
MNVTHSSRPALGSVFTSTPCAQLLDVYAVVQALLPAGRRARPCRPGPAIGNARGRRSERRGRAPRAGRRRRDGVAGRSMTSTSQLRRFGATVALCAAGCAAFASSASAGKTVVLRSAFNGPLAVGTETLVQDVDGIVTKGTGAGEQYFTQERGQFTNLERRTRVPLVLAGELETNEARVDRIANAGRPALYACRLLFFAGSEFSSRSPATTVRGKHRYYGGSRSPDTRGRRGLQIACSPPTLADASLTAIGIDLGPFVSAARKRSRCAYRRGSRPPYDSARRCGTSIHPKGRSRPSDLGLS